MEIINSLLAAAVVITLVVLSYTVKHLCRKYIKKSVAGSK